MTKERCVHTCGKVMTKRTTQRRRRKNLTEERENTKKFGHGRRHGSGIMFIREPR